jgi:hypothetical protein
MKEYKMRKILITGFRHSGTTMLHQLIKAHPQVGFIENESSYIEFDKPVEWILLHAKKRVPDLKKYAWGEKLPWGSRETDVDGNRAINFIDKWLKYFKGEARVLHILRHPADAILSTGSNTIKVKDWEFVTTSVPIVIDHLNKDNRCATVVYEYLVTSPEVHLNNILHFLDLQSNQKIIRRMVNTELKFGKINADRAFAFKKKNISVDFDYEELIKKVKVRL